MILWQALAIGVAFAAGLVLVWAGFHPAPPDLRAALARLDPQAVAGPAAQVPAEGPAWLVALRAHVLPPVIRGLRLDRLASDLRILDRTPEWLAARKIGYAAAGFVLPAFVGALAALVGTRPPFAIPAGVALVLAGVLFAVPDVELRRDAAAARESMRRAVGVFVELVALERVADAGTTEALDRAVAIGTSREFDLIRDALVRADLTGHPSWQGLADLATWTGVADLDDLADVMSLAGSDGAAVYATLRARAGSMRTARIAAATAKANAASEHMVIPVALLGAAFMALLGYPALVRILTG